MVDITDIMLQDRICDASDRIPTTKWPFYAETLTGTIPIGASSTELVFTAERDTTLTDLSIAVTQPAEGGGELNVPAGVTIDYCNTMLADNTDVREFDYCCQRKPVFLVGVKEDKKLKFQINTVDPVADDDASVLLTVSGFQGQGCCQ